MAAAKPVFESISPFFPVGDVTAAIDFYCHSLGFELGWKWGEPPTQANVCRDAISVSLSSNPSSPAMGNVFVQLKGVDGYYADLRSRGVKLGTLASRDYGMRDFLVVDPWGNRLVFGEPVTSA